MEESDEQAYAELIKGADEVIIAKVPMVDFYERFSRGGKTIVYLGTQDSFDEWKRQQVN